ncbi:TBC1 domain family member 14-like [Argiope bruennichi]|uniref:TBC1 domain family member 14 like protein n=1 Tax=Argiope bruennichi TaxID=94029 RepID=A0A8T0E584_ARGBR|nr:TBC1 domain family member 14-like [Argiope bruennichi]KAF8764394.1 TBC1 domain family member 14 like protein [Argiope bruennichi]
MPSSGTEVHSINEVWTKKHLTLPVKSLSKPDLEIENKEDFDDLLHLKCRLINTAGNERSEVDVKLPYERPLINRKGSPIYSVGKKDKPTLDEVLGSIPLVYNPFTKQLELESRSDTLIKNTKCFPSRIGNGTCFPMDRDGSLVQRDRCKADRPFNEDTSENRCKTKFSHREKTETMGREMEETEKADVMNGSGDDACAASVENNVPHSPTATSLQHTDTSSFTSMSSVGTEHSFGIGDLKTKSNPSLCYSCDNLQSLPDDLHKGAKPKKWGLSNLFLKLPWKSKSPIEDEEEQDQTQRCPSACSSSSRRSDECIATSTTALILENRPPNLPAKSFEEEAKHKQQYEEMIRGARKKELQDAKFRKKQAYHQQKLEEQLINATKTWNEEILPSWNSVKENRKTRDLWWKGLPPSIRGRVWKLAIGNDLNITQELFDICTARSKEKIWVSTDVKSCESSEDTDEPNENAADFIKLDVSRTFPQLGIFQEGGPYHNTLEGILGAYVIYRPDIGYVQGMSFLAAMLLLNLDAVDSFICFCNLLNRQCQLAFFRIEQKMMTVYYSVYEEYFKENLPKLFNVFAKQNLSPDLYLVDWLYTLYSKSLPLDVACRVWDVYLRDGEEFLVKTALGILKMYEDILLEMDFIHLAQFLTKLPEDIDAEKLFQSISAIRMTVNKKSFSFVLQQHIDSLSNR